MGRLTRDSSRQSGETHRSDNSRKEGPSRLEPTHEDVEGLVPHRSPAEDAIGGSEREDDRIEEGVCARYQHDEDLHPHFSRSVSFESRLASFFCPSCRDAQDLGPQQAINRYVRGTTLALRLSMVCSPRCSDPSRTGETGGSRPAPVPSLSVAPTSHCTTACRIRPARTTPPAE